MKAPIRPPTTHAASIIVVLLMPNTELASMPPRMKPNIPRTVRKSR
jgi:hypothetical protein